MAASRSKWLAYAQLLRLPNLFTAIADPLAGWLIVNGEPHRLPQVLGASACLYTAGIVFNDCMDHKADCRERPERPLPRGEISRSVAASLATLLIIAGLLCAFFAGRGAFAIALIILIGSLLYNAILKTTPVGPLILGACRSFNMLLGMTRVPTPVVWPALTLGLYVLILSSIARREDIRPSLRRIVKNLLLGIIVLDAVLVFAFTGNWIGALLVLSLLLPAWALSRIFAMT